MTVFIEVAVRDDALILTLPWPPTVNTYYRNVNGKTLMFTAA